MDGNKTGTKKQKQHEHLSRRQKRKAAHEPRHYSLESAIRAWQNQEDNNGKAKSVYHSTGRRRETSFEFFRDAIRITINSVGMLPANEGKPTPGKSERHRCIPVMVPTAAPPDVPRVRGSAGGFFRSARNV